MLSSVQPTITPTNYEDYKAQQKARAEAGASELGKQDFLNLLVAQMKNQDPLSPMENTEFMNQTTAFSQLEQMINMNSTLTTLLEQGQTSDSLDQTLLGAASYIGREVEYSTNVLNISDAGITPISFYANEASANASVRIYNEEGSLVATKTFDRVQKGANAFTWDGMTDGGVELGKGTYYFEVTGTTVDGGTLQSSSYGSGLVSGVTMSSGRLYFQLENGGVVPAEYIYAVKQPQAGDEG